MNDNLDVQTYDSVALSEIELIANLMITATNAGTRLSTAQIDQALGIFQRA